MKVLVPAFFGGVSLVLSLSTIEFDGKALPNNVTLAQASEVGAEASVVDQDILWEEILTSGNTEWGEPLKQIRWWGVQGGGRSSPNLQPDLKNSFEKAREKAKEDNRPLFVQIRCLP